MSCRVMSCHVVLRHVMSCNVMSCRVTSRHVMSRHTMSCHVKIFYVDFGCFQTQLSNLLKKVNIGNLINGSLESAR